MVTCYLPLSIIIPNFGWCGSINFCFVCTVDDASNDGEVADDSAPHGVDDHISELNEIKNRWNWWNMLT